jgi:multidrug efflux system membrane fusion protein
MFSNRQPARRVVPIARRTALTAAVAVLAAAVLVACQPAEGSKEAPASAATSNPAPPVAVFPVQERMLDLAVTQVARVEASQRVDVRPRVAGQIEAVLFREGDPVRAGQALFRVDARPFDAAVARAEAESSLARTREAVTRSEAQRARQLAGEAAIAAEEYERRAAAHAEAQARLDAADAALQTVRLDREYAVIRAPIDGRIGRALVTAGNVVAAGTAQMPLATIVSTSPLHVHFDVADRQVIDRLPAQRHGARWQARVLDADGRRELAVAPVDFADNEIVAATGTLRLRARIDAPGTGLLPGQFVRVELAAGTRQSAMLVPDKAIGTDQGRRFVLVVGADRKVEYRPVDVGAQKGDLRVVTSGLKAGEQVIVSGLMRVRPGMTVAPQEDAGDGAAQALGPRPERS